MGRAQSAVGEFPDDSSYLAETSPWNRPVDATDPTPEPDLSGVAPIPQFRTGGPEDGNRIAATTPQGSTPWSQRKPWEPGSESARAETGAETVAVSPEGWQTSNDGEVGEVPVSNETVGAFGSPMADADPLDEDLGSPAYTPAFYDPAAPAEEQEDPELEKEEEYALKLGRPFSEWDFARIEGPLFGREEISEFSARPLELQGKWSLRPHLSVATIYDGNIFIQEENKESDFILRIAPGVSFRYGDGSGTLYLTADYTLGFVLFSTNDNQNSLDQSGRLNLEWQLNKLTIGFHVGFEANSGTSIDVTDRVKRNIYYVGITTNYVLSPKFSLDVNADTRFSDYSSLISSNDTRLQTYLNYNLLPKVVVGVGSTFGYTSADSGPNQRYWIGSLRASWFVTGKFTLNGVVGYEIRNFDGGGRTTSPVFGLDAAWAIRSGTTLQGTIYRNIYPSAVFDSQDYTDTGITLGVTQRFTDRANLFLTVGVQHLDYFATSEGVNASRKDTYYFIRPGFQLQLGERLSLGVFYEYSRNVSSGAGARDFSRDRGGVQLGWIF